MLELRPICEHCGKDLPNDSTEAMICTFECTFCRNCVDEVLDNVCPNCGGGFEKRPTRPKDKLLKYPPKTEKFHHPVDLENSGHCYWKTGISNLVNDERHRRHSIPIPSVNRTGTPDSFLILSIPHTVHRAKAPSSCPRCRHEERPYGYRRGYNN